MEMNFKEILSEYGLYEKGIQPIGKFNSFSTFKKAVAKSLLSLYINPMYIESFFLKHNLD